MILYILTSEPYHDNSSIFGVYTDREVALAALQATPDPTNINGDDYRLVEWDTEANAEVQRWEMNGTQVREVSPVPWSSKPEWHAVRREYVLTGGSGK
jgi:hypothetical protein